MTTPPRKRWSFHLILGVALLGLAGTALLLWAGFSFVGWRRSRAMEREIVRLVAESVTRNGPRPVAVGASEPGNAWDEYQLGLEELVAHPVKTPGNLRSYASRSGVSDRPQVLEELEAHRGALEHLTRGARRAEWRVPFRWEGETLVPFSGESLIRKLAELAICRVRMMRETGDPQGAMVALLEIAQYGRDMACNTTSECEWEGLGSLELALAELEDLVLSRRLRDADLDALERGLRTIDETLARDGGPLLNDVAFFGRWLQKEDPYLEADGTYIKRRPLTPGWRHGFSMGLFKTDAFNRWLESSTLHAAGGRQGWNEAKRVYAQVTALLESPPENQAVNRLTAPSLDANRTREARLRLLRVAVHFLRTGEKELLADPFGAAQDVLLVRNDARQLRAWSRGPNGVDDEGSSPDRPRNTTGSTTIIGPALDAADDLGITVDR